MITWNDFKCAIGLQEGKIENVNEYPGNYSLMWCPEKGYINNCDNCPFNEKEKEMRADPNSYQKWLKLHSKNN